MKRRDPPVSHHFDSAADRADGRINPCDLYAFPGAPGSTTLILTVNPDAGRSSPTTFRPDARYEFAVASDGGTTEDIAFGRTGEVFPLTGDGLAWAGLAADPFTADGIAIGKFNQSLHEGRYTPEVFADSPSNAFAGRDVTAIALQLPDADLGSARISLWARISLYDHIPQRQVNRIGQAMFRPLFF